jgi:hypothetical protein
MNSKFGIADLKYEWEILRIIVILKPLFVQTFRRNVSTENWGFHINIQQPKFFGLIATLKPLLYRRSGGTSLPKIGDFILIFSNLNFLV